MKIALGLLALVVAQEVADYSDLEKGKNKNACSCDTTPSDCSTHCLACHEADNKFIKNCGKTYAKSCKKTGFKKGMCKDNGGGTDCPTLFPTQCSDCMTLGKKCIKSAGHSSTCKGLGYKGKKGCVEEPDCDTPTSCNECMTLFTNGDKKCMKKHKKTCKGFGYSKKTGCPTSSKKNKG